MFKYKISFLFLSALLLSGQAYTAERATISADDDMKSIRSSLLHSSRTKADKKVDENSAAGKLDSKLYTPMGAERAGNAEGTIPEWTSSMDGLPKGMTYKSTTDIRPDAYANEKPLFIINSKNMMQYADKLSDGQQALLKKYPNTFTMPIYPSHRDNKISDYLTKRVAWNAEHTKLVNGVDGLRNYTGGIPFPFPADGAEAMWNGRVALFHPTVYGSFDQYAVYPNNKKELLRQLYISEFPFSFPDNIVGVVDEMISVNMGWVYVEIEKPDRAKGQIVVIHEAVDQVKNERMAWAYMPGSRRVRRAPTVGFDTPDGPGGIVTVDDALGYNGAMYKYSWKLIGKKELYIPYNNYKFDTPNVPLDTLLLNGHANPEFMRYELHRAWIVEANLKAGQRHIYAKRRFYMDEDSWQIVYTESYDARNELWRVGILNTVYDYLLKSFIPRVHMFHDLQSGAYLTQRMVNYVTPPNLQGEPKGEAFYSPSNLRTQGIN